MAILCHNPVTLAALFELDILIYSLHGFMGLEASPCSSPQRTLQMNCGKGEGDSKGEKWKEERFDASAENTQAKRMVYKAEWGTGDT